MKTFQLVRSCQQFFRTFLQFREVLNEVQPFVGCRTSQSLIVYYFQIHSVKMYSSDPVLSLSSYSTCIFSDVQRNHRFAMSASYLYPFKEAISRLIFSGRVQAESSYCAHAYSLLLRSYRWPIFWSEAIALWRDRQEAEFR